MATGTGMPNTSNTGKAIPTSSRGLSSGAKAGIGIGVAVVAVAIIAGIVFFLQRRNSKNTTANLTTSGNCEEYYGYGQKLVEMGRETKPSELGSEFAHELPGGELRHEMNPESVAGNTQGYNERRFSWERTPVS
jgi:hypothetical protein